MNGLHVTSTNLLTPLQTSLDKTPERSIAASSAPATSMTVKISRLREYEHLSSPTQLQLKNLTKPHKSEDFLTLVNTCIYVQALWQIAYQIIDKLYTTSWQWRTIIGESSNSKISHNLRYVKEKKDFKFSHCHLYHHRGMGRRRNPQPHHGLRIRAFESSSNSPWDTLRKGKSWSVHDQISFTEFLHLGGITIHGPRRLFGSCEPLGCLPSRNFNTVPREFSFPKR
jgi:hypothetical protein